MSDGRPADLSTFDRALALVDTGDVEGLGRFLAAEPAVVSARCPSIAPPYDGYFHGATLLHHVAGNPIRGDLPATIVEITRVLLDAGADPDATCGGGPAQPESVGGTTIGLLTSGKQAHVQGLTEPLLDALLEGGATLDPEGGMFGTLYHTVEHQGQRDVAWMLWERGVRADLPITAGLGNVGMVEAFFAPDGGLVPDAGAIWARTAPGPAAETDAEVLADALLCAAVNGRHHAARRLIERGAPVDVVRHWGAFRVTPLHGAAWAGWVGTIDVLIEAGADVTAVEPTFGGTPRGWAEHAGHEAAAEMLRRAEAGG